MEDNKYIIKDSYGGQGYTIKDLVVKKSENSSTYLYYLALAYDTINKALKTKYPYPSIKELENLKKRLKLSDNEKTK